MRLSSLPVSLDKAIAKTEKDIIKRLKTRIEELEEEVKTLTNTIKNTPKVYDTGFLETEHRKHVTEYGY